MTSLPYHATTVVYIISSDNLNGISIHRLRTFQKQPITMPYTSDAPPLLLEERMRLSKLSVCFRFSDLSTTYSATGIDVATESVKL